MRQGGLVVDGHGVDVDGAALDLARDPETPAQVLGVDGAREAVVGVVGDGDGLVVGLHHVQRHGGAEGLGVVDVHALLDVLDDDGPHPGRAGLGVVRVAVDGGGALGHGVGEQRLVLGHGQRGHELRHAHAPLGLGAEDLVHGLPERGAEGVGHLGVHQDAFGGHADLARVQEGAERALQRRGRDVGVLAHDGGRFAAEFHHARLEEFTGLRGDDGPHGRGPREVDLPDGRVRDECRGHAGRVGWSVVQGVETSRGEPCGVEDGRESPVCCGRRLGAFENHGVAPFVSRQRTCSRREKKAERRKKRKKRENKRTWQEVAETPANPARWGHSTVRCPRLHRMVP